MAGTMTDKATTLGESPLGVRETQQVIPSPKMPPAGPQIPRTLRNVRPHNKKTLNVKLRSVLTNIPNPTR